MLLMSVATVWETLWQLNNHAGPNPSEMDGYIDSFWGVVELAFTIFFAVEVLLKLICYGWRAYWSDITNRCGDPSTNIAHARVCSMHGDPVSNR